MLVALLVAFLMGGGGGGGIDAYTKEHHKLVKEFVADEERAAAVVAEMKSAQKSINGSVKEIRGVVKRWKKIDADPGSGRAELEPLLRESTEIRSDALRAYTDSLFEMREQMTAEEWEAVYGSGERGD